MIELITEDLCTNTMLTSTSDTKTDKRICYKYNLKLLKFTKILISYWHYVVKILLQSFNLLLEYNVAIKSYKSDCFHIFTHFTTD